MKKQTKSNFLQMATLLPELDVEKQRRILGGTAVAVTPPEDVNMIPVTTVAPCLTVESIPMTTTMAPAPILTSPVETSSMPVSTISTPLETMPTPEMVTPSVPVLSCVTVECVPTITTMAPEPTLTSPVETSSMPVSTVSTPLEITSTPEMVTPPSATTPSPISSTEIVSATTSSWWDDVCDYCVTIKDAAMSLVPDAITVNVSFDFAFLGGGDYEAGYAFVFKGPDAGHLYSFDTYNFALGFHAEATLNVGAYYYTGNVNDLNFMDSFGGRGCQIELDYLGGLSFGSSSLDKQEECLWFVGLGYGASVGVALDLGYTNVRKLW